MRNLASVQRVHNLSPIPNADAIEVATVQGWQCVVKKAAFTLGDLGVYIEIDSVLPDSPHFEFMRDRKWRVRTIKLRGQISQGLMMPLSILPKKKARKEGDDVTEELGIKKWEPCQKASRLPRFLRSSKALSSRPFPSFLHKTDETRVQVLHSLLEKYRGHQFYCTEKLDGQSFTAYLKDGKFGVCSRNWDLKKPGESWYDKILVRFQARKRVQLLQYKLTQLLGPGSKAAKWLRDTVFSLIFELVDSYAGVDNNYWDLATELELEDKMRKAAPSMGYVRNLAIQGEMCGPGIQGNKYGLPKRQLYLFQVVDIDYRRYFHWKEVEATARKLGVQTVPYLGECELSLSIPEWVKLSEGQSKIAKVHREGIVLRPVTPIYDPHISQLNRGIVSFKVINPQFLLKYEE